MEIGIENTKRISLRFVIIYCVINFFPHLVSLFWIMTTGEYRSEFRTANLTVKMDYMNVLLIFLFFFFLLILTVALYYCCLQDKKFIISKKYKFHINRIRYENYLIIIFLSNLFLLFSTGVGKAGGEYSSSLLSSILALLNFDFFFWIYFIKYSRNRNRKFYLICFLFIILELLQGWSSFIITFFFIILCSSSKKWQRRLLFALPFVFLLGGLGYTFVFPFKMLMRFGKYITISYGEGILHLFERLTKFPNACVSIQNQDKIIELYKNLNFSNEEIMSFFYPWISGFLMPHKSQRLFNNLVMLSVYPDYSKNVSAGMGISYIYMIGKLNIFYILVYLLIYILYFYVIKVITDSLIDWRNPTAKYLSFVSVFQIVMGISFRQFGAFVPVIWTFVILIFMGCIKIRSC